MISFKVYREAWDSSADVAFFTPRQLQCALLLFSAVLLIAATYLSPHIWRHGEAREALVIEDIVKHHHWLLPLRNQELPSKPVLYHWIGAGVALLFGVSDFTVRSPSILAAVALVWLTYRLGLLTKNRKVALLAVAILATTYEFWDSGTEARVDMVFAALLCSALTAWYLWYTTGANSARAAAYLAVAGAVLTKGPAGAVLPVLAVGLFLLLQRDWSAFMRFISWRWLAVAVTIVASWYLGAYYLGGSEFFYKQIVFENVERFLGAGEFHTQKNVLSQARWFVTQLFPWSLLLLWTLARRLRDRSSDRLSDFLHCWWSAIFIFFLVARGQRAVYLLPIYPAVAALAALECATLWRRIRQWRGIVTNVANWQAATAALWIVIILLFAVAVPASRSVQEEDDRQEEFVENVVAALPAEAKLFATIELPETVLLVLAYRLGRDIQRQPLDCNRAAYYLVGGTGEVCPESLLTTVVASSDRRLGLLRSSPSKTVSPRG